ncbi:hypothetical protein FBR03_15830 [Betaproteobacteria bacterium PRO1]|nr:hypothetical protein [Betaproteobacteria bacterium PRO1]
MIPRDGCNESGNPLHAARVAKREAASPDPAVRPRAASLQRFGCGAGAGAGADCGSSAGAGAGVGVAASPCAGISRVTVSR